MVASLSLPKYGGRSFAGSSAEMCASGKSDAWPENGDTLVSCHIITGAAGLNWVCLCLLLAVSVGLGFRKEEYLIRST